MKTTRKRGHFMEYNADGYWFDTRRLTQIVQQDRPVEKTVLVRIDQWRRFLRDGGKIALAHIEEMKRDATYYEK